MGLRSRASHLQQEDLMHKRLEHQSLLLSVMLMIGTGACAPTAPPISAPTQVSAPTVTTAPSVAASPSAAAAPSVAASPSAAAAPSVAPSPSSAPAAAAPRPAGVSLMITSPTAGQTVNASGSVTVIVSYIGPTLVAAANATKLDDYHLHYLLDVDPTPYIGTTVPIPLGDSRIMHTAATTITFDNVAPGSHTLTVIMSGSNHISVNPPVAERTTFTAQ
jgi:hypothetical protein